jgi:zinc protease
MLKKLLVSAFIAFLLSPALIFGQKADRLPPINVKEFQLKNGLRVVLHEDHSTPVVAVNMWYHVGSKNEAEGRTGFAHLFEHMMFQGSKNYVESYSKPLQEAGGIINGTTDEDRTYYYEVVPSNFLELALYMEADRMGGLLEAMSQEKLDNQRDVVKNEKRQRLDNQPYGSSFERGQALMYPKGHPYNWLAIGSMEDLSAASMDDVKSFFRQYYVPNNAVLVLSGDFNEKQARAWIEKYFGSLAKGSEIKRPDPPMPKLNGEIRKTFEDTIPLPRVYMVWHSVPRFSADEPALDILSYILTSGRTSRLQADLVYDKQIAQSIVSGNDTHEIGGLFEIQATARPGKTLDEIEKEINTEIERIKNEPPTDEEMNRAISSVESSRIYALQTVLGKGAQMSTYAGFLNKPDFFQNELDAYRKVTAADVQRVAKNYLTKNRLVMNYVPGKGEAQQTNDNSNRPTSVKPKEIDEAVVKKQTALLPKPGPDPKLSLPAIEKTKLSNGLEVWFVRQTELPIVSMNLVTKSGATFEPEGKNGIAALTAALLDDGTKTRSAVEIVNNLQSIGAFVNSYSGWDSTNVTLQTLTKNLDQALDIYADIITDPAFPADEFENLRKRALVALLQQKSNPEAVGDAVFNRVLYGNHPYGNPLSGNENSINSLKRDDIIKFYESIYRPNNSTLIVVGDVSKTTLLPKLEKAFAGWKNADVAKTELPVINPPSKTGIYLVDRPGAPQSVVSIGQPGLARDNPDFYAVQVMNSILGGGGSGRLYKNLRETKGYTYGAYSQFAFRRGSGPFEAAANVQTAVTKESVEEFIKEISGIRGEIPVTPAELEFNKQSLIRRYPLAFETVGQISNQLSNLVIYGLPDSYFNDYISRINAVTIEDVNRAAKKYLDPAKMAIVIVGDRKKIEPKLKELGYPLTLLDTDGNVISE